MKINVCSETELLHMHGEGVSTSFLNCVDLLNEKKDVEVVINSQGLGDIMHCHTYGPYYFIRGLKYKGKKVFSACDPRFGKRDLSRMEIINAIL